MPEGLCVPNPDSRLEFIKLHGSCQGDDVTLPAYLSSEKRWQQICPPALTSELPTAKVCDSSLSLRLREGDIERLSTLVQPVNPWPAAVSTTV